MGTDFLARLEAAEMRDSERSNYSERSGTGSPATEPPISSQKSQSSNGGSGDGQSGWCEHHSADAGGPRELRRPPKASSGSISAASGESSSRGAGRRRSKHPRGGEESAGTVSGGTGRRKRRETGDATPLSSYPCRHGSGLNDGGSHGRHGHSKSRRSAAEIRCPAVAAEPSGDIADRSGGAHDLPELDVQIVISATWAEEAGAPGDDAPLNATQLAARVAMLKARRTGVGVELREHARAKEGILGREPTEAENQADEWWCGRKASLCLGSPALTAPACNLMAAFWSAAQSPRPGSQEACHMSGPRCRPTPMLAHWPCRCALKSEEGRAARPLLKVAPTPMSTAIPSLPGFTGGSSLASAASSLCPGGLDASGGSARALEGGQHNLSIFKPTGACPCRGSKAARAGAEAGARERGRGRRELACGAAQEGGR